MLKNLIKITYRNLLKNKLFSIINIAGLMIGFTGSGLILIYVLNELSVNSFIANSENIFRIDSDWEMEAFGNPKATLAPMGPALFSDYQYVVNYARMALASDRIVVVDENSFIERIMVTDTTFFQMFNFSAINGDLTSALRNPNSVVITENLSRKYFGTVDALGKTLLFNLGDRYLDCAITGIIETPPFNSITNTFGDYEIIMPMTNVSLFFNKGYDTNWFNPYIITFVELSDKSHAADLSEQFSSVLQKYCPDAVGKLSPELKPLAELYLNDDEGKALGVVKSLLLIALFIIIMACINFITFSTSLSINRSKEICLRKVVGANRKQLIFQFLGEAVTLVFIAMLLSAFVTRFCLSYFSSLVEKDLPLEFSAPVIFSLVGLTLLVGLLAGIVPTILLSSFQPAVALKRLSKFGKSNVVLRRILVVFQFVLATILLIGAVFVSNQLHFIINKDLGFNQENVLVIKSVPREWTEAGVEKLKA